MRKRRFCLFMCKNAAEMRLILLDSISIQLKFYSFQEIYDIIIRDKVLSNVENLLL